MSSILQFWCYVIHLSLLIKTDFTVICVPCMLEHVCDEAFSLENYRFEDILYYLVEICVLSGIYASKTPFKQIK